MRLIDADALDAVLRNEAKPFGHGVYDCGITDGLALARDRAETAPTIDAVPVVRCGECKHYKPSRYNGSTAHYCGMIDGFPKDHWFCMDGQRREEGDNGKHL